MSRYKEEEKQKEKEETARKKAEAEVKKTHQLAASPPRKNPPHRVQKNRK